MTQRVLLRKLKSTHSNLRTSDVEGFLVSEITLNEPLRIMGAALSQDAEMVRVVTTSPVSKIEGLGTGWLVHTQNSVYEVRPIPESRKAKNVF